MLSHPTRHKLEALKLHGMAKALEEQSRSEKANELGFEERLGLLIDREMAEREDRRLTTRLRHARLRLEASAVDIDFKSPRGLDRTLVKSLLDCRWIEKHRNLLITGATGCGKTYLACAFGHEACRGGYKTGYFRASRLFEELSIGRGDGRYARIMSRLAKLDLLIIDDWGIQSFTDTQRTDLLEILEDRHGLKSTVIASQLPVDAWHKAIGNPTLADAILDRLIHNAHTISMQGGSMRKTRPAD
jgi:DNA replication protein DnaC